MPEDALLVEGDATIAFQIRLDVRPYGDAVVQSFGNAQDVLVRLLPREGQQDVNQLAQSVLDAIKADAAGVELRRTEVVGPQVGKELAEKGALAIMCGGSAYAVERACPVMASYGARIVHVGGAGAGQTAKMANQMCIAGTLAGLSEAVRLVQASGLDSDRVLEAISGGAAQSWQMENRWKTMMAGEFDFGFAIDWMRKDLGLSLEEGRGLGVSLPVAALIDQFFSEIQAMGGGRLDTSAIIKRLPTKARK